MAGEVQQSGVTASSQQLIHEPGQIVPCQAASFVAVLDHAAVAIR